jgi:GntR family transcriptional repressor for pyruvate dehydrogenase complex
MERMGLVWQVEQELERIISLGLLPKDGLLPSEHTLAQRYGVSRTTVRKAVLRLAVKGLVVQRPGRKSRAVALDEAVTLENLSVALHTDCRSSAERLRLLEGYLALKRETMVELLAACCEHASEADMDQLEQACYALGDAVRWEQPSAWMRREFELLRQAALSVQRPGHFLLIQSLERSFWGMAARVLPHLDKEAVSQWARCAFNGVCEKDVQALRQQLPTLMQAADEHLLHRLAPPRESTITLEALHSCAPPSPERSSSPETAKNQAPAGVCPNLTACMTGSEHPDAVGAPQPEAVCPNRSACRAASRQPEPVESPLPEAICPNRSARWTASRQPEPVDSPLPEAVCPNRSARRTALGQPEPVESPLPESGCPNWSGCRTASGQPEPVEGPLLGAVCPNRSACRTALDHVPPTGGPPPERVSMDFGQPEEPTGAKRA